MKAMSSELPAWAEEMRDLFKSGSVSQFLLHGNVFDTDRDSRSPGAAHALSERISR